LAIFLGESKALLKKSGITGFLMGIAFLTKQTIITTIFPFFALILLGTKRPKAGIKKLMILVFLGGFLSILSIFVIFFQSKGGLADFYNAVFAYNFLYFFESVPTQQGLSLFDRLVWLITFPEAITSMLLISLTFSAYLVLKEKDKLSIFLFTFLISSLAAVKLGGLREYKHYYVMITPALAITFTYFLFYLRKIIEKKYLFLAILIFAITAFLPIVKDYMSYLSKDKKTILSLQYGVDTGVFNEAVTVAAFVKKNTQPNEKILVIGDEPEIYYFSEREPATKFIYLSPLRLKREFFQEFNREIMANQPKMVIYDKRFIPRGNDKVQIGKVRYVKFKDFEAYSLYQPNYD